MSTNTGNNDMVIIYHTSRSYILLLTCYIPSSLVHLLVHVHNHKDKYTWTRKKSCCLWV